MGECLCDEEDGDGDEEEEEYARANDKDAGNRGYEDVDSEC